MGKYTKTTISHIVAPVILIIKLVTKSPDLPSRGHSY